MSVPIAPPVEKEFFNIFSDWIFTSGDPFGFTFGQSTNWTPCVIIARGYAGIYELSRCFLLRLVNRWIFCGLGNALFQFFNGYDCCAASRAEFCPIYKFCTAFSAKFLFLNRLDLASAFPTNQYAVRKLCTTILALHSLPPLLTVVSDRDRYIRHIYIAARHNFISVYCYWFNLPRLGK